MQGKNYLKQLSGNNYYGSDYFDLIVSTIRGIRSNCFLPDKIVTEKKVPPPAGSFVDTCLRAVPDKYHHQIFFITPAKMVQNLSLTAMKNYFCGNLAREELLNCRNQAGETFSDHWKNIYPCKQAA